MIKDFFFLALAHLTHHQKRTWLTMIGIFIGVGAVVALISLGQGLQDSIHNQFSAFGVDKIIISGKRAGFGPPGSIAGAGKVTKDDLSVLSKVSGTQHAAGMILKPLAIEFGNEAQTTFAMSLPEDTEENLLVTKVHNLRAETGRLLKKGDKRKIVLGYNLAHKLVFSRNIHVGDKLFVSGKEYRVIGVADRVGDPASDTTVFLMEEDMRSLLSLPKEYTALMIQIEEGESPQKIADAVKRALLRDRHQKEGKEDFDVETSEELLRKLTSILQIVTGVLGGIAAVSLLVGGIGIMNTMYTAVLERTRDIGIMKAIGATNADIMAIFLIESGLLGAAGGIAGILLGTILSKGVELLAAHIWGPNLLHASIPWYLLLGALGFSFFVGMISGALPARQAARLKPSDALRYE